MRVLLDTHTLLWWLNRDANLSPVADGAISNANLAAASAISAYESALKSRQGKLVVPRMFIDDFTGVMTSQKFYVLAIDGRHASIARSAALSPRSLWPFALRAGHRGGLDVDHQGSRTRILW